jgi:hypothetical protein
LVSRFSRDRDRRLAGGLPERAKLPSYCA